MEGGGGINLFLCFIFFFVSVYLSVCRKGLGSEMSIIYDFYWLLKFVLRWIVLVLGNYINWYYLVLLRGNLL